MWVNFDSLQILNSALMSLVRKALIAAGESRILAWLILQCQLIAERSIESRMIESRSIEVISNAAAHTNRALLYPGKKLLAHPHCHYEYKEQAVHDVLLQHFSGFFKNKLKNFADKVFLLCALRLARFAFSF